MKKIPFLMGLLFVVASLTMHAQVNVTWNNNQNIGEYKLTKPGTYKIKGTVRGNINVELNTQGTIIIEGVAGTNPMLIGKARPGQKRAVGHVKGDIPANSKIIIRNVTLKHTKHHIIDFGGPGRKHVYNVDFIGEEYGGNFGVAPGNMGGNGLMENCYCRAGDDGHQVSLPGSEYRDNHLEMFNNGSAFQFGWKGRFMGRPHHADNIKVTGNINPNTNGKKNDGNNPGRCVIGGVFNNNGGDIKLTNLDLRIPKYNHLIKMVVGTEKSNVVLSDILIQGTTTSVFNYGGPNNLKAIAISALKGGAVKNMVVDLGDEAAKTKNHFIKGNVDVKFLRSDGSAVVYKGGKLQTNTDTKSPTTPGAISFASITKSSVNVSWGKSTDNVGVTGYDVYMNNSFEKSVSGTSATITGLDCNTSYAFKVRAKDAAGNTSSFNASKSTKTSACGGDNVAPTAPGAITFSNITKTSVKVNWGASSDNIGVTGYDVFMNNTLETSVTGTTATITGLTCNKSYAFKVRAKDAAGNSSVFNTSKSATTNPCGSAISINITNIVKDCNAKGKPRNVIAFTVTGSTKLPKANIGQILNDGNSKYRLRHIGAKKGSTTTYKITVESESVTQQVTAVNNCPKSAQSVTTGMDVEVYPNPTNG
ncbi:MAG: fibronectin type III domain-containing protein, partial [Bacteroidales bacterium]|nr:fibronectin type III domain-containing protein [Bacteroidales bacterium]